MQTLSGVLFFFKERRKNKNIRTDIRMCRNRIKYMIEANIGNFPCWVEESKGIKKNKRRKMSNDTESRKDRKENVFFLSWK